MKSRFEMFRSEGDYLMTLTWIFKSGEYDLDTRWNAEPNPR